MRDAQPPLSTLSRAMIVSARPALAAHDRRALRRLGVAEALSYGSGSAALAALSGQSADVILCDDALGDMSCEEFLRRLRQGQTGRAAPAPVVVVVSDRRDHDSIMGRLAAGCHGYVIRPYAPEGLGRNIRLALQAASSPSARRVREMVLERLEAESAPETPAAPSATIEPPQPTRSPESLVRELFELGARHLRRREYDQAIAAFSRVTAVNRFHALAWESLAEAWTAKGDPVKRLYCLQRAAEAHARLDRFERAQAVFLEALRLAPDSRNPYAALGMTAMYRGDYPGAVHAFRQALRVRAEGEQARETRLALAEACMRAGETELARQTVAACAGELDRMDDFQRRALDGLKDRLGVGRAARFQRLPRPDFAKWFRTGWFKRLLGGLDAATDPDKLFRKAREEYLELYPITAADTAR